MSGEITRGTVVGKAGPWVGWTTQCIAAINTLYSSDIKEVSFEYIDDYSFIKDGKDIIVQVKSDMSGQLTNKKIKEEVAKMKNKASNFTLTDPTFEFIIDTNYPEKFNVEELNNEHQGVTFYIYDNLIEESVKKIEDKIIHINVDKTIIHIMVSFIAMIVSDAYKSIREEKAKKVIKISRADLDKRISKISYPNIFELIYNLEAKIMSSEIESALVKKEQLFREKYNGVKGDMYNMSYSRYMPFRSQMIELNYKTAAFFKNMENGWREDYIMESPQDWEAFKLYWKNYANESIWLINKTTAGQTRIDSIIRRGVLIYAMERSETNDW